MTTTIRQSRFAVSRIPASFSLVLLCAFLGACTSAPREEPLNSERIEARFGNYDVEVLFADQRHRVANLFSVSDSISTTRTFAIVEFANPVPELLTSEHALVVDGNSIGEVFRAAGWHIAKQHQYIGSLRVGDFSPILADLMHIPPPSALAVHVYLFSVFDGEKSLDYATIVEIHHPDYFHAQTLQEAYGANPPFAGTRDSLRDFVALDVSILLDP